MRARRGKEKRLTPLYFQDVSPCILLAERKPNENIFIFCIQLVLFFEQSLFYLDTRFCARFLRLLSPRLI